MSNNDNTIEKLNNPEPFDPSQFGDLSDIKVPEPKAQAKPIKPCPKHQESANVEPQDEATLLANVPKVEGKKEVGFAIGSERIRNAITKCLEIEWPAAYAHYRALKYPTPGTEPTLAQRKTAYEFAFRAFLALTYQKSLAEGGQG